MDRNRHPILALLAQCFIYMVTALALAYAAFALLGVAVFTFGEEVLTVVALLVGACLIWLIVRYVNRRDDSRRAEASPDPP